MSSAGLGEVFILGAGPVARALARTLREAGHGSLQLWARREESARKAALETGVTANAERWPDAMRSADTLLFAVRDDAIGELAVELQAAGILDQPKTLLHCAGSLAAQDAFGDISVPMLGLGLCHPLRAISAGMSGNFRQTTFGVQGDVKGLASATLLVQALGASSIELQAGQMPAYHAAAAIASNYIVALMDLARDVLVQAGVDGADTQLAFASLAKGAIANVAERGIPDALTGPIRRGDADTVHGHLEALGLGPSANLEAYRVLGRRCLALAEVCGDAEPEKLREIALLLAKEDGGDPANS